MALYQVCWYGLQLLQHQMCILIEDLGLYYIDGTEILWRFGYAGYNVSIMVMTIIFVESQYILPKKGDLINTQFINANKPMQFNNRQDLQR